MNAVENVRGAGRGRQVGGPCVRRSALLLCGVLVVAGCAGRAPVHSTGAPPAAGAALVRFTSCGDVLRNLRAAAGDAVGPGGFVVSSGAVAGGTAGDVPQGAVGAAPGAAPPPGASAAGPAGTGPTGTGHFSTGQDGTSRAAGAQRGAPQAGAGAYSGTNTAEAGVDEPDLVKTDGQRIVTVIGDVLRVVDARSHRLTGVLDLPAGAVPGGEMPANLLLAGDRALVLFDQGYPSAGMALPSVATEVGPPVAGDRGPAVSEPGSVGSARGLAGSASGGRAGGTQGVRQPVGAGARERVPVVRAPAVPVPIVGPRLLLVDLSTPAPQILSTYTIDGALVDARQVGSVARVVVRSAPRVFLPSGFAQSAPERAAANRAVIAHATVSAWLPRYALTQGNVRRTGQVDCAAASHPAAAVYSGTSMLTVLTFDLSSDTLGDGQPLTVVADGTTVYSNGASLYIADDQQPSVPPAGTLPQGAAVPGSVAPVRGAAATAPSAHAPPTASPAVPWQYTGLYKFDISGRGRPVYEASGTVPGWLLGSSAMARYALSEWNGALRVATTTVGSFAGWSGQPPQSAVYVLEQAGDQLVTVGKVGGLGQGEQIYAVRFAGPVGYVVTFRQVDPLYTVDLSDPARPRVAGELPLLGYSAYLDPIDATHLIGVGQDANAQGQTQGTQVSLFDTSDLAAPVRLAVYRLPFAHSEAEFDPHAFLYWPASRLLVIPVQLPYPVTQESPPGSGPVPQFADIPLSPLSEAIALRVGDHAFIKAGTVTHPPVPGLPAGGQIRRSLVASGALWTLSDAGLKANDVATLTPEGWVPFN